MAENTRWQAWGSIVAETLPAERVEVDRHVFIEPLDDERLTALRRERPTIKHIDWDGHQYFSALPGDLIVRSRWAIWFQVQARDMNDALYQIEELHLPAALAALTVASVSQPPRIELLRLGRVQADNNIPSVTSPWAGGTFGGYDVRPMAPTELQALRRSLSLARGRAADLARRYCEARRQHDIAPPTPAALIPVVSAYFLIVEQIARERAESTPFEGASLAEAERAVQRLQRTLDRSVPLQRAWAEIRQTSTLLDRLEGRYINQKIEAVGTALAVDSESVAAALDLAKLRNSTLSHPGRRPPENMGEWAGIAEKTARVFLSAVLRG